MSSSHHRRREVWEDSWNRPLIDVEAGDLVLYWGRLAEVISPGARLSPMILDVTDEGGIVHTYTRPNIAKIELLGKADECVLDDLDRAAGAPRTAEERRRRIAELWLADPRVGDLFELTAGQFLEIVDVGEAGTLWAAIGTPRPHRSDQLVVTGLQFSGAQRLRQHLASKSVPVYAAQAHSTMRPDFQDHELIRVTRNSPLWTGSSPSEQISKERTVI